MDKKDIAELREELKKLKKEYQDLTGEPLTIIRPDTLSTFQEVNEAIKSVKSSIESAERSNLRFSTGFRDIHDEIIAITGELSKSNSNINLATKAFKGTQDIVQKLKYDEEGLYSLSHKNDADNISVILKEKYGNITVMDATAGVGGNSISFGQELCRQSMYLDHLLALVILPHLS